MVGSLTLSVIAHEYEHESIYIPIYICLFGSVSAEFWCLVN